MKNCPNCGTPLTKTSWRRYLCPNCGIVGQDNDAYEPKEDNTQVRPGYVG